MMGKEKERKGGGGGKMFIKKLLNETKNSGNKLIDLNTCKLMENLVVVIFTCNFPPPEQIPNTLKEKNQLNDLIKNEKDELLTKLKDLECHILQNRLKIKFLLTLLDDPVS